MIFRKQKKTTRSSQSLPARRQNQNRDESSSKAAPEIDARLFRRNRTIGPSDAVSPGGRTPRETSHQLRKKRRSLTYYLLMLFCAIAILGTLVYQLTSQVTISLYGSLDILSKDNQAAYQVTIDKYFASRPAERLRFLTRADDLSVYLQQHGHTEVESVVSLDFADFGKTALVLRVREPVARWVIDKKLQFVDERGSVFTKSYYATPNIKIVDKSGISATDTRTVTSSRFLGFIGRAIGALDAHGYDVEEVIIPPSTTRQVQLKTSNNIRIKMAIDRMVGEQAEDAARTLSYLSKQKKKASYIDVRVTNRAYYK